MSTTTTQEQEPQTAIAIAIQEANQKRQADDKKWIKSTMRDSARSIRGIAKGASLIMDTVNSELALNRVDQESDIRGDKTPEEYLEYLSYLH